MNLPRHSLTSHAPRPAFVNAHFTECDVIDQHAAAGGFATSPLGYADRSRSRSSLLSDKGQAICMEAPLQKSMMTCATREGFFVAHTDPFKLIVQRDFSEMQGGLAHASLIDNSSLMVLVGGGRVPRFAPNKVILWDEDAIVKIPIPPSDRSESQMMSNDSGSEGTLSPPPSTLFSVGQEQDEQAEVDESKDEVQPKQGASMSSSREIDATNTGISTTAALAETTTHDGRLSSIDADAEEGDRSSSPEHLSESYPSMHHSITGALLASSANMDDPFDMTPDSPSGDDLEAGTRSSNTNNSTFDETNRVEPANLLSTPPEVEQERFRIERGREVAELEFGEAVQGITVQSFELMMPDADKSKTTKRNSARASKGRTSILVVSLQSKAVIFELTHELGDETRDLHVASATTSSKQAGWIVRRCLAVDIYPGSSRCLPAIARIKATNCALIALPGRQMGHVQLVCVAFSQTTRTSIGSSLAGASTIIAAHSNAVTNIVFTPDAQTLCTASERGTLIRLWSTMTSSRGGSVSSSRSKYGESLNVALFSELRRGTDAARILSLAISPDSAVLAAASEKGTIHFFDLTSIVLSTERGNEGSSSALRSNNGNAGHSTNVGIAGRTFALSRQAERFMPSALQNFAQSIPTSLLPQYFKSQWSFAQFHIVLKVFSGRRGDGMRRVRAPVQRRRRDDGRVGGASGAHGELKTASIGEAIVPESARNLDGGWATMRGRVDDIRRGEKTIEEAIWLRFVPVRSEKDAPSSAAHEQGGSAKRKSTVRHDGDAPTGPEGGRTSSPSTSNDKGVGVYGFHLVAITSSGGHYRLAVSTPALDVLGGGGGSTISGESAPPDPPRSRPSSSSSGRSHTSSSSTTVLDMYRSDQSNERTASKSESQNAGSCWLVEYSRFGNRDAWLD